ncbi:hypothetical protein CDAR_19951 [Caerostris darwini]|uniref:Uncharacterized protein n=1 Tax=Caerostris darwini TaxID=1538125 RepID=A0AAV4PSQ0_9ARAC|nr:hypothetical protein CDAR_19951 [Caerostris darwini]
MTTRLEKATRCHHSRQALEELPGMYPWKYITRRSSEKMRSNRQEEEIRNPRKKQYKLKDTKTELGEANALLRVKKDASSYVENNIDFDTRQSNKVSSFQTTAGRTARRVPMKMYYTEVIRENEKQQTGRGNKKSEGKKSIN